MESLKKKEVVSNTIGKTVRRPTAKIKLNILKDRNEDNVIKILRIEMMKRMK